MPDEPKTLAGYARQALMAANGGTTNIDHHDPAQSEAFRAGLRSLLKQANEDAELANLLDEDGGITDQVAAIRRNVYTDRIERALLIAALAPKES